MGNRSYPSYQGPPGNEVRGWRVEEMAGTARPTTGQKIAGGNADKESVG